VYEQHGFSTQHAYEMGKIHRIYILFSMWAGMIARLQSLLLIQKLLNWDCNAELSQTEKKLHLVDNSMTWHLFLSGSMNIFKKH